MQIIFDESDAKLVAKALAKSRDMDLDFDEPFGPGTLKDQIYNEGLRVIAAFRRKYGPQNAGN